MAASRKATGSARAKNNNGSVAPFQLVRAALREITNSDIKLVKKDQEHGLISIQGCCYQHVRKMRGWAG